MQSYRKNAVTRLISGITSGKKYLRTYARSENSDQPALSRSLICIFTGAFWIAMDAKFLHADNETARVRRLI